MSIVPAHCHHITVKHNHGELDRYLQDGCRCDPCKDANTARMREYRATRQTPMVPASEVRTHVRALLDSGHTWHSIAQAARLDPSTVRGIDEGIPRHGENPRRNVRKTTATRILNIRPDPSIAA